jgi:hypothetical protein
MSYPRERKGAILKKRLPPNNRLIKELAREAGLAEATVYHGRKAARAAGRWLPDGDTTPAGGRSADKFAAVVETAALNETPLSTYARERALYPEPIRQWRGACEQAHAWERTQSLRVKEARRADARRLQALEREQREKALAETAALWVLRKKARAIWGDAEEG